MLGIGIGSPQRPHQERYGVSKDNRPMQGRSVRVTRLMRARSDRALHHDHLAHVFRSKQTNQATV